MPNARPRNPAGVFYSATPNKPTAAHSSDKAGKGVPPAGWFLPDRRALIIRR